MAIVVIVFVLKVLTSIVSYLYLEDRKRLVQVLILSFALGDLIVGFSAFVTCGEFQSVSDDFGVKRNDNSIDFDMGLGWDCFLSAGFLSWLLFILSGVTLWRGVGGSSNPNLSAALTG